MDISIQSLSWSAADVQVKEREPPPWLSAVNKLTAIYAALRLLNREIVAGASRNPATTAKRSEPTGLQPRAESVRAARASPGQGQDAGWAIFDAAPLTRSSSPARRAYPRCRKLARRLALHRIRTASARQAISAANFPQFQALNPSGRGARLHPPAAHKRLA